MIGLVQRVRSASVSVTDELIGEIDVGALVMVGVQRDDTLDNGERLIKRCLNYRIFPDDCGRMNHSLTDIGGGLLLVPQFTLAADTTKGTRASFGTAMAPDAAKKLFESTLKFAQSQHLKTASGRFGADMQVALINDGPVTFWLAS